MGTPPEQHRALLARGTGFSVGGKELLAGLVSDPWRHRLGLIHYLSDCVLQPDAQSVFPGKLLWFCYMARGNQIQGLGDSV